MRWLLLAVLGVLCGGGGAQAPRLDAYFSDLVLDLPWQYDTGWVLQGGRDHTSTLSATSSSP